MLAEAPSWLQEWARSRNDTRRSANSMIPALAEPSAYLKNRADGAPSLAARVLEALTPWSINDDAQLRSALAVIPAVDRDIWLRVGMAIHEARWGERGRAIWDEWSQSAPKKFNETDQERTWASFDRPYDGQRRTLGSVFQMAKERGWTAINSPDHQNKGQSRDDADSLAPNSDQPKASVASDIAIEIVRLAKLSWVEYDRERQAAADRLKIRVGTLDKEVEAERGETDDSAKQGRALNLPEPEPWPEPVNGAELLDGLSTNIRGHVVMADHAADTAALWVVHTFLLDCFGTSPRLAITSPEKQCGKTTLLDILSCLVWRALLTANASVAAVFRIVEVAQPTLLIDEADTFLHENEELRGILNSGHRKNGSVLRVVGDDHEARQFSTYSPCAIALIGRLPATLADRSIAIELRRRRANEPIGPFRFDRTGHLDQLARKAARWATDSADRIRAADPDMPAGVFNRVADNWRPLLCIADAAGGEWSARARQAVQCTVTGAGNSEESIRVLLLVDIRTVFTDRNLDRVPSADLVGALNSIEGRPWAEWNRGKGLSPNGLARLLAPFRIAPATIRTANGTPKGYQLAQFEDAFARYLPRD
jgi:Protein of unknown function (DUF3631)/Primase C terminal 2 (PriCT-2)